MIGPNDRLKPMTIKDVWRCSPHLNVALCAPPKCGSRSVFLGLAQLCYPEREYTYESATPSNFRDDLKLSQTNAPFITEAYPDMPRVGIIRNPMDRFRSLCQHQVEVGKAGLPNYLRGNTVDAMIKAIQNDPQGNNHWRSQTDILAGATTIVPFEDMAMWWEAFFGQKLPYVNKSVAMVRLDPAQEQFVRHHYIDDFDLYGVNLHA